LFELPGGFEFADEFDGNTAGWDPEVVFGVAD
jgi:hypothetical protein